MTPKIIGLCGYSGSGKDTTAAIICEKFGFTQIAFADKVRETLMHLNPYLPNVYIDGSGAYYADIIKDIGYEKAKRTYSPIRNWLVKLGHGLRAIVDENIWITASDFTETLKTYPEGVVISDVRYVNEARAIKAHGGEIWYIFRPGVDAICSEEKDSIQMIQYDYILTNSGTLKQLENEISKML